ncbi:MAG: RsmB/NOP family class I SAM-dependent RNA methyltransferase [Pseudomonadota bacterium]
MSELGARQGAIRALEWVLRDKRMLAHFQVDQSLGPADQARGMRLAMEVLRNLGPTDELLRAYLDRKPPLAALMVLRLATVEMLVVGEDAFGVVDSAVKLMKGRKHTARMAGFVNAVLRRVAAEGPDRWAEMPAQRLPGWIGGELKKRFGVDALRAMERAHAAGAPVDLTRKRAGDTVEGADVLPTGSLRLSGHVQVSALPGYAEGAWWVQDVAAALPVRLLGDVSGQSVLDLCAAPGGKTMQLAAAGADVTALDLSEVRMARVRENLTRTGLSAKIVVADAFEHTGKYDAILLDAPCSATGTIRRHPDLPFLKKPSEVEDLTRLQMRMIDHALTLLKPGGRLVYCTCSLLPVEGEFQVKAAVKRHENLSVVPVDPEPLGGEAQWASPEGGLRLRPDFWADRGGMDGFYMALLQVA